VLGGIASGKSLVARLLAGPGGEVIDADALAREALEQAETLALLREHFGDGVFGPDGRPNREAIGKRVFADADARALLEGWIHPAVRVRITERLAGARERGTERVVLDVPLLLENDAQHGLAGLCDVLVFVDADEAERERRAVRERGWPAGELARREATQMPPAEKRARAHHVILNHGDPKELEVAAERLLNKLERVD
jgi:dephospho-CoA kinase